MKKSLCALCSLWLILLVAVPAAYAQTPGEELEKEAQTIDRMIMCPVCPAETIDQAQVEISFQMRAVVREMLAEGKTREEILDFFVERYGPDILAAPPKSGANLLAWILPIVGVAAGLGALFLVIRAMTGRKRPIAAAVPSRSKEGNAATEQAGDSALGLAEAGAEDPELSPYLEIVDRSLASRRGMRPHPNPPPEGEGTNRGERPAPLDSRLRGNDGGGEGISTPESGDNG